MSIKSKKHCKECGIELGLHLIHQIECSKYHTGSMWGGNSFDD